MQRCWHVAAMLGMLLWGLADAHGQASPSPTVPAVTTTAPSAAPSLDLRLQLTPLPVTELPGVTVRGTRDPLQEGNRRLDELKASLPCMGCERYKPLQTSGWMLFAQGFLPTEAPPPGPPEDRARMASQVGHCTSENPFGCMGMK